VLNMKRVIICLLMLACLVVPGAAEAPRGSITIDRIAAIKYPTNPAFSPDGRSVAFLWDAAGKQDLFVVTPGQKPVALTDFPVDPDLLVSDIGAFAWVSPDEIIFGKDGQLWTVSPSSPRPERVAGLADASGLALSPDGKAIAFLRRGQIWIGSLAARTERQLTFLAGGVNASVPVFSRDGKWLAFTSARNSVDAEELRWNGDSGSSTFWKRLARTSRWVSIPVKSTSSAGRTSCAMPGAGSKSSWIATSNAVRR
jgi:hypothetical protein